LTHIAMGCVSRRRRVAWGPDKSAPKARDRATGTVVHNEHRVSW
jgi:hypothetical protein